MSGEKTLTLQQAHRLAQQYVAGGQFQDAVLIYRTILEKYPNNYAAQEGLWKVKKASCNPPVYFSQNGQDEFVYEHFFKGHEGGFFVDVGAYDGVSGSNTLFFERSLGWDGLCIEASPTQFSKLKDSRQVECLNVAIADFNGEADFLDVHEGLCMMSGLKSNYDAKTIAAIESQKNYKGELISIGVRRLSSILHEEGLSHIDYLSIDVEGSESSIIEEMDFGEFNISVLSIECSYNNHCLREHLQGVGFEFVTTIGFDQIYRNIRN